MSGKPRWTPQKIVAAVRAWHDRYGEVPGLMDWTHGDPRYSVNDVPHGKTVRRVFGTWNAAIEAAGLTPRQQGVNRKRGTA